MKKLSFLFLFISTAVFAQEEVEVKVKKHELKANAFNTIVFKAPEFSYEYLLDAESSFGISLMVNLNDVDDEDYNYLEGPYYEEKFALTAFYRRYFSRKYAWGFFLESFGMFNSQELDQYDYDYINNVSINNPDQKTNNFALGISVGGKFVSKKGFVFEVYGGVGRNIISSDDKNNSEIVPRLGASLGYRF